MHMTWVIVYNMSYMHVTLLMLQYLAIANSSCNTVIAILLNWFRALDHVFHTDVFAPSAKFVMCGSLHMLTHSP